MRRLALLLASVLLVLAFVNSASARWGFHWRGHGHWGHVPRVRHYASHWHRPHYVHRYSHRHFHHRHYVHRYYTYPSFSFHYVPRRYYYHYPVRYYSSPYCASSSPIYSSTYSYSVVTPTPLRPKAEYHAAADVASWIKLADRFIKEARRDDLRAALVSRSSKASTEETRKPLADADRIIQLGDDLFRAGRYEEALKYYESAGATARESAAAYFRRGQAYVATGRYDEAVDAFKRGVDADPSFLNSGFRLQDIYAQEDALTQHVEALAAAALRKTDDADLLFLIGAFLHFEGKAERAEKFLRRAAELAAEEAPHIHEFIAAGKRSAPLRLTSDFTSWSETANAF